MKVSDITMLATVIWLASAASPLVAAACGLVFALLTLYLVLKNK